MTLTVVNGKLSGPNVTQVATTKKSAGRINKKQFIVVHYTASNNYAGDVKTLSTGSAQVSCHIVIGRKGEITMIGSFDDVQWHAGASSWKGISQLNGYSIGIELTNPGYLKKTTGTTYATYYGEKFDLEKDNLVLAKQKDVGSDTYGWLPYTKPQIDALVAVVAAIKTAYKIDEVVGHEQISPGRKQDPGIGIILSHDLLKELNGEPANVETPKPEPTPPATTTYANRVVVNAPSGLRIRSGPSASSSAIGSLANGARIKTIWRNDGWLKLADRDGYVKTEFTKVV